MSYISALKKIPAILLQPTSLAIFASVGIHALALPTVSVLTSQEEADKPYPIDLVDGTQLSYSNLPELEAPPPTSLDDLAKLTPEERERYSRSRSGRRNNPSRLGSRLDGLSRGNSGKVAVGGKGRTGKEALDPKASGLEKTREKVSEVSKDDKNDVQSSENRDQTTKLGNDKAGEEEVAVNTEASGENSQNNTNYKFDDSITVEEDSGFSNNDGKQTPANQDNSPEPIAAKPETPDTTRDSHETRDTEEPLTYNRANTTEVDRDENYQEWLASLGIDEQQVTTSSLPITSKEYPLAACELSVEQTPSVEYGLVIAPDGTLSSEKLLRSSGYDIFDSRALEVANKNVENTTGQKKYLVTTIEFTPENVCSGPAGSDGRNQKDA